ncbi:filament plant protein [Trifolium repens]|nr:filament plant protein [Trifolium repens]
MDQKQWQWGKKTREKTILETDKTNLPSKENEEVQALMADKEKLEKELRRLNDKLAFTLSDCNTKDEHMKKQTMIVQEAVLGWEKAETELLSLKEHLEESIHQELVYEERVAHLDCALKECMRQLHFVREEQEKRIYDAVVKVSIEFDQARVVLEEQLSETSKRLAKTVIENSYLNKSIIAKDNLIDDLNRQLTQAEVDRNALMIRLESVEKDNTSLTYEAQVLQKELDIRNEVQFSRVMLSQTASKLLKLERKDQVASEQPRSNLALQELSSAPMSDIGSDYSVSCAESSASALISALERLKSPKQKGSLSCQSVGPSDINLMDDFIEMEKLAVVSVEKDAEISHASVETKETLLDETTSVSDHLSEFSTSDHDVDKSQRDLNESIGKMIELIEGINVPANNNNNQGSPTGYMVRVFQWKTSDLGDVLLKILNVCYSSLDDKADHEKFAAELTAALEWIINHCFLLRDVSSMEDAIKKQFSWDDTQSENEAEIGMFTDAEKLQTDTNRFQELEKTIAGLRLELQTLKESNRKLEDQIQNQASINTVLETQLTETELKEAYHKILELEVELESKNQYCEELDTKCVELQLQLQSTKRARSNDYINQKNSPVRTEWEITAASEKLAECQETILNLEKQLKEIAATKDVSIFDNIIAAHRRPIITNSTNVSVPLKYTKVKNRPTLLDQMLAEDEAKAKACKASERSIIHPLEKIVVLKGVKGRDDGVNVNSLAILPVKKYGRLSLWKRMLGTRRKLKRKQVYQFNK